MGGHRLSACSFALLVSLAGCERAPTALPNQAPASRPVSDKSPVRLISWNIQKGEHGLDQIIAALKDFRPDVVLLQEAIRGRASRGADQAGQVAEALGLALACDCGELDAQRQQCIAILSAWPLRAVHPLRSQPGRAYGISATATINGRPMILVCVHLAGTWKMQPAHISETFAIRKQECEHLAEWIAHQELPMIIAGDFNPIGPAEAHGLEANLRQAQGIGPTFPSASPALELDRVFYTPSLRLLQAASLPGELSDHLPILAEFQAPAPP